MSELEIFWLVAHERKQGSARSTARHARLARPAVLIANPVEENRERENDNDDEKAPDIVKRSTLTNRLAKDLGITIHFLGYFDNNNTVEKYYEN